MEFVAALVVFYFVFKPFHGREFNSLSTPVGKLKWGKIFFAFFVWMGLSLVIEGINYYLSPGDYSWNFKLNTFLPLLALCILVLPLQTSFEELFFRGYLMQGIGTAHIKKVIAVVISALLTYGSKLVISPIINNNLSGLSLHYDEANTAGIISMATNFTLLLIFGLLCFISFRIIRSMDLSQFKNYKVVPLIITSVLFGLIHSANPEIEKFGFGTMQLYYITAGLMLGIMTIMDDGLELALGTHAATNFTGAVFVGYDGAALSTDSLFTSHALNAQTMTYAFIALAIVFLITLKVKYNWTSFTKVFEEIHKPDLDEGIEKYIDYYTEDLNSKV